MFDRRLRAILVMFGLAMAAILTRLVQLQVVQGSYYRERAERSLLLKPHALPFVRGSILDRTGLVLVSDEPCWDLCLDYDAIAFDADDDSESLNRLRRRWKSHFPEAADPESFRTAMHDALATMWVELAGTFSTEKAPLTPEQLRDHAREIHERIQRIREAVAERRGFDSPVAEERQPHAIIPALDGSGQIVARERLSEYPWLHIEPASRRAYHPYAAAMAHVLGRTGRVDAEAVAHDPNPDDPFVRYLADEDIGITGVEAAAESQLRGRRGREARDRSGNLVEDIIEAQHGGNVTITINAELQHRLYDLLGETVEGEPYSAGGAIVVLDVASREVLALVSYPSYDPAHFNEDYSQLRDDTVHLPLWFRAIASRYPPGSTIKPLTCLAGLMSGKITTETRVDCRGYLFPEHRDRWRCWEIHGEGVRMAHGPVNVTEALMGSCNIFMYTVGGELGVQYLTGVYDMVGIGRHSGIELGEDNEGINPWPSWLVNEKGTPVTAGHARNFAIGQGELALTPVQVANLMATYADGYYQPVTILRGGEAKPRWRLPVSSEQWLAVRKGIYGVVNEPAGTAYRYAHFLDPDYVLCGKTGSATAYPWPTAYRVPYVDADGMPGEAIVPAGARDYAIERFKFDYPGATPIEDEIEIASRWPEEPPPDSERHSHAWFGGYLQRKSVTGGADFSQTPRVAFALLVEFGGSGGRTTGPLAMEVSSTLLDVLGRDLRAGGVAVERGSR
ncbi:MAG: hypothetical protein J5J06_02575 [Phycisphaerae bacterium]|nr:hypothetical protein [Phycisphaerae bacterium]